MTRLAALGLLLFSIPIDAQDAVEELFNAVADDLPSFENRLVLNLNDRELASGSSDLPRLGGFADLPPGLYPDSAEIEAWETAFRAGEIGGLVLHSDSRIHPLERKNEEGEIVEIVLDHRFVHHYFGEWINTTERHRSRDRIFITFSIQNATLANLIGQVAKSAGYDVQIFATVDNSPFAWMFTGQFYATAQYRLAIDSRAARRLRTDVTEMQLLGERTRRDSDSVYRDPANRDDRDLSRNEPTVFRKITLGDEFNQPTIEEIVVPGGIALGESARIDFTPVELVFTSDTFAVPKHDEDNGFFLFKPGSFSLHGQDPETGDVVVRQLPDDDPRLLKSLFDLAQRSIGTSSDAVVDLDADSRVRISSALRDTDAGYDMLFADTLPFRYLDYLPVTKSVIIDTGVVWRGANVADGSPMRFVTDFEVRFLSADRMRIAQTRLALEYEYNSATGAVNYGGNWGRDSSRLRNEAEVYVLGSQLTELARYAGWVALFRRLEQDAVPFLKGRYQFMKIDKAGRETPRRFR